MPERVREREREKEHLQGVLGCKQVEEVEEVRAQVEGERVSTSKECWV